ncbi:MAG: hypothetical protein R3C61_23905 [Bacteroidia bacterium]
MRKRIRLLEFFFVIFSGALYAQPQGVLLLSPDRDLADISVAEPLRVLPDGYSEELDIYARKWKKKFPSGFYSGFSAWITGSLCNAGDTAVELFFLNYRFDLQWWAQVNENEPLRWEFTGQNAIHPRGKPIEERHSFRIVVMPGQEVNYLAFLADKNSVQDQFTLDVYSKRGLYSRAYQSFFERKIYLFIFLSSLAIMGFQIIFALLFRIIVQQRMYVYYACYIASLAFSFIMQYGDYLFMYIPLYNFYSQIISHLFHFIAFAFYFLFADSFFLFHNQAEEANGWSDRRCMASPYTYP